MSPEKTKPIVWLCPEANDASSASGWLKDFSPQRRQASKKENPGHTVAGVLFFGMRDANFPAMTERSSVHVITPAPQVRP